MIGLNEEGSVMGEVGKERKGLALAIVDQRVAVQRLIQIGEKGREGGEPYPYDCQKGKKSWKGLFISLKKKNRRRSL